MKLKFNRDLYRKLQRELPEGYQLGTSKERAGLFIFIRCEDSGYFSPWYQLPDILKEFGW